MSGLLKPLLKTARTATRIVAASDADAKSKAGADYVCGGVDDQVTILAAINSLPNHGGDEVNHGTITKTGKVDLRGHIFYMSANLDIPPVHDFVFESEDSVIDCGATATRCIRLDSSMNAVFRFGLLVAHASGSTSLEIRPRTAGPDGFTVFHPNFVFINGAVGEGGAGSKAIFLNSANGVINHNHFHILEAHGQETMLHIEGASNVHRNYFLLGHHHSETNLITDSAQSAQNTFAHIQSAAASKINISGTDQVFEIVKPGLSLILNSGAERNRVFCPDNIAVTDNSGGKNAILTYNSLNIKKVYSQPTLGTEAYGYYSYAGYRIDADNEEARITIGTPEDFHKLMEATIVYIALATVTGMSFKVDSHYAAPGELCDTHTSTITITRDVTADYIYEDDISSVMPYLSPHDFLGIRAYRPVGGNTNIVVLGIRISYAGK